MRLPLWLLDCLKSVHKSRLGDLPHERHQCLHTLPREGCEESLCLPDKENLPGHPPLLNEPKKVENSKASVMVCIHSSF